MAGGSNAATVACWKCVGRAVRTDEGAENDWYECTECGFKFGVDWSRCGPPQKPCWPLTAEETAEARRMATLIYGPGAEPPHGS
jgi:hypothetical protein